MSQKWKDKNYSLDIPQFFFSRGITVMAPLYANFGMYENFEFDLINLISSIIQINLANS